MSFTSSLTIKEIKKKFENDNYKEKLPTKKHELLDLYEKIYGKIDEFDKMTLSQLKSQLKDMNYSGKIPTKKCDIINVIKQLKSKKGFEYKIVQNTSFNKVIEKLTDSKHLNLSKMVDLNSGIDIIHKLLPNIKIVIMNLNTDTNICTFKCIDDKNLDNIIFLLVQDDNIDKFEFVQINDKIILNKADIPSDVYSKLLDQCDSTINIVKIKKSNNCDNILDELNISYNTEIIPGDGNCFYTFIARALQLENSNTVRKLFADHFTNTDWELINNLYKGEMMEKKIFNKQNYIDLILLKDGVWVRDSDVELLFQKAFPNIGLVLFNNTVTKCDLICPLIFSNKQYYIFGRYQTNLHYDLYKINGKNKLSWDEIPTELKTFIKNTCAANFKNIKFTENEYEKISRLTIPEIKLVFQQQNFIGKLPNHKKQLLELFKQLFVDEEQYITNTSKTIDYESLSLQEILTELKKQNITKNLPRKKDKLLELLKSPKCNPMNNEWCDDDKICDVMNNICVDKSQLKGNIIQDTIDNHHISGTKTIINDIKTKIKNMMVDDNIEPLEQQQTEYYLVQNKNQLLKYLSELQKSTIDNAFNNFLQTLL